MADQLVLDIPGVTTIWAGLRVGEQHWHLTHQPAEGKEADR